MSFWSRRVLVTGGTGFIGSHLVERLLREGARVRTCGRSRSKLGAWAGDVEFLEGDLAQADFARRACQDQELIFHLAAVVGGVGYNSMHAGSLFRDNVAMGMQVLEAARCSRAERILMTSSACVYPRHCTVPTPESEGFLEDPEQTNLGYGWAKRLLEVQARCYAEEYSMQVALPRPYNAYGPRDDFEWETSHVIPSLIRKVVDGHNPIVVWGDGSQTRDFLYVTDLVEGLMLTMREFAKAEPINLGSGEEITLRDLLALIIEITGSNSSVQYDTSKPSGQPRRLGDYSKARALGFQTRVSMREGLRHAIEWYISTLQWL